MTAHFAIATLLALALLTGCRSEPAADEWLVFSSARSGEGDIYALNPATLKTVKVAGTTAPEGAVRYDAARDRVIYSRYEENRAVLVSGGADLFVDPNGDTAPAWSPDGQWIVYAAMREGRENLYLAQPDGSEARRLTEGGFVDRYPAWSPDSSRIVFARKQDDAWDLFSMAVEEGEASLKRLTTLQGYVGHPAWSPNGRFIAFDALWDGQAEIAVLELETGRITRLTDRLGNDLIPAWSRDNRRIAFGGEPNSAGNWDVWVVDLGTLGLQRLTTEMGFDGAPVFVPASAIGR